MKEMNKTDQEQREGSVVEKQLPGELPFFIVSDLVLFPRLDIPLELEQEATGFINHIWGKDRLFAIFTRDRQNRDNIYDIGTAVYIRSRARTKEGGSGCCCKAFPG